jgi:hypothetical protein
MRTIRKDESLRKTWEVINFGKNARAGIKSIRARVEYDCRGERYRRLSLAAFEKNMAEGNLIETEDNPTSWRDIPPDTVTYAILELVCSK